MSLEGENLITNPMCTNHKNFVGLIRESNLQREFQWIIPFLKNGDFMGFSKLPW
jgi:hypothetical protein